MITILIAYLILSLCLIAYAPIKSKAIIVLSVVLPFYSFVCLVAYYISNYFSGETVDERFIFHLKLGLAGIDTSDYLHFLVIFVLLILLLGFCIYKLLFFNKKVKKHLTIKKDVLISLILLINPFSVQIMNLYAARYISPLFYGSMTAYYHPLEKPKNDQLLDKKYIVVLYLESLEKAFYDERLFENVMPFLKKTTEENLTFNNVYQVIGTGFTTGGIVSSQCGKPLLSFDQSRTRSYSNIWNSFLGDTYCLSDYFRDSGYTNYFIGGADYEFGGKKNFLLSHSFLQENIVGSKEFIEKFQKQQLSVVPYKSLWGFYDEVVLNEMIEVYEKADDKSYIVGLTIGTHHPGDLISPYCESKFNQHDSVYLNILACTDDNIKRFIEQIQNSPKAKDTLLILASDHLAMANPYIFNLQMLGDRENLLTIIDFANPKKEAIFNKGSTLDIGATLLDYLNVEQDKLGFGVSLLNDDKTLIDHFEDKTNNALRAWTNEIVGDDTKVNLYNDKLQLSIDELVISNIKTNTFPIILSYDAGSGDLFEGVGNFDSHPSYEQDMFTTYNYFTIMAFYETIQQNSSILWLDYCERIDSLANEKINLFKVNTHNSEVCYINIKNKNDELEISFGVVQRPYFGNLNDLLKARNGVAILNEYTFLERLRSLLSDPHFLSDF